MMEKIYTETATVGKPDLEKQNAYYLFTRALTTSARH